MFGFSVNDPDNNNGCDDNGHGTHVAGLLAATTNNNTGIASTAFNCSVMSVKCTHENEDPSYITNGYSGLLYAAKAGYFSQGFSIINLSWGGGVLICHYLRDEIWNHRDEIWNHQAGA